MPGFIRREAPSPFGPRSKRGMEEEEEEEEEKEKEAKRKTMLPSFTVSRITMQPMHSGSFAHPLARLLVRSLVSLTHLLTLPCYFAHVPRCAHSSARSLTHLLLLNDQGINVR